MVGTSLSDIPLGFRLFSHLPTGCPQDYQAHIIARQVETLNKSFHWDNHARNACWVVQVTLGGCGRLQDDARGKQWDLPVGTGFVTPFPSATSYWRSPGQEWDFVWFMAVGDGILAQGKALFESFGPYWEFPKKSPPSQILTALHAQSGQSRPDSLESSLLCHRLILELWRQANDNNPMSDDIAKACAFITKNLADPALGVDAIAKHIGVSSSHFSRRFHTLVGQSPYAFILTKRLQQAMTIITSQQHSLQEIARRTGFSSYPNFCERFRQHFRLPPSAVPRSKVKDSNR